MKIISYIRVSTERQGRSGLGLEAQQAAVRQYARDRAEIVAEYREVETGKRADRPELAKAIRHAKRAGATLVVAKLDRLARNAAFCCALLESGVEFVCCDNPHANRLTIQILAAVAEDEARRISDRTREALRAAKARGRLLGAANPRCRRLSAEARQRGARRAGEASAAKARDAYADLLPAMAGMRNGGATLQAIADRLNADGQTTSRGGRWSPTAVLRVLSRA